MGDPIQYAGTTTGFGFSKKGSRLQVSWSVRSQLLKVNIKTVAQWLESNVFAEIHAHGVRNLAMNTLLLSATDD